MMEQGSEIGQIVFLTFREMINTRDGAIRSNAKNKQSPFSTAVGEGDAPLLVGVYEAFGGIR